MISSKIDSVELTSVDPSSSATSRSGVRYSRSLKRQYWRISVTWVKMKNREVQALYAQLVALEGEHGTAAINIPLVNEHPSFGGSARVLGTVEAGKRQVSLVGHTGSLTPGGTFNFSGHSKLYMVVSQENELLTFTPSLRRAVAADSINYASPTVQVYRTKETTAWKQARVNSQITDEFEEALE